MELRDVEHEMVAIDTSGEHAYNQVNVRRLRSGRLVAVFNEERFAMYHEYTDGSERHIQYIAQTRFHVPS